jgi:tight adherence protein C
MLYLVISSTFGCIALFVMSLYWITVRERSAVTERLDQMDPAGKVVDDKGFMAVAERLAAPVNEIVPISAVEAAKIQKQLMHAGYRDPNAAMVFRAIQLIGITALPCTVAIIGIVLRFSTMRTLVWGMFAAAIGFYLPKFILKKRITERQQRLTWGLADALDLMVIAVEAGLSLNATLIRVGEELRDVHPVIQQEFELVNLEIRVGRAREEALRNLAERTGVDDLRSFVALMIQADRYGSSVGKAVRIFADSLRTKRRQRAEQKSQKAMLRLLFPLTFFLFPVVIMIILGPTALNLIDLFSH